VPQPDVLLACPFCDRGLVAADLNRDGRYSCPDCAPTVGEAMRGWKPTAANRVAGAAPRPVETGLSRALGHDPMFSEDKHGDVITRAATCECGIAFTQRLLSERFLNIVEKQSAAAIAMVTHQSPGYFVPTFCPKCERIDIGHQARLADMNRTVPDDRRYA
jgi:hypothetical protein